ncbi:hypothetical protein RDWZM_003920 [Blomia tropicalis]|uniref:Nitrogen permease regulator 2-like protein n=1 Tax=Blomia tropicalis TaxID=40697 RepID=A0A9Q0MG54_BLOTA|nr:hypothetical protein RDWZM_003920 [Blomia tropicalis]
MRSNYLIDSKKKQVENDNIKAIIFCEFDVNLGPILKYQHPIDYISKETFESLIVYLIPKSELHGKLITINAFGHKILGYPVSINDPKYNRNQLIFNLCFVFSDYSRTTQYEPIIQKLAHYLIDLEYEMALISKERFQDDQSTLLEHLIQIKKQLNDKGVCIISISESTTIHLKVAKVKPEPGRVEDYHVPVIINPDVLTNSNIGLWDLTTQQIFNYINGFNHISKIAFEADVELNLVKACVQNLIYYGIVSLIPIFQYSNVYVTTPKICSLIESSSMQEECLQYVRKLDSQIVPSIKVVLLLYSNMCPGMTVKDLCQRFNPNQSGIDEQRLVRFGLMNGIIRRIQKYPILLVPGVTSNLINNHTTTTRNLVSYFNGKHSYDQISCELHKSYYEIEEKVEKNPSIVVCWK